MNIAYWVMFRVGLLQHYILRNGNIRKDHLHLLNNLSVIFQTEVTMNIIISICMKSYYRR